MSDDYSDILGRSSLPVRPIYASQSWTSPSFILKSGVTFIAVLTAGVVLLHTWSAILKWREKSYRLAMRRKHGIPDWDHRPFNVAYRDNELSRNAADERKRANMRKPPQETRQRPIVQPAPAQPVQIFNAASSPSVTPPVTLYPRTSHLTHPNHVKFADGYNTSNNPIPIAANIYNQNYQPQPQLQPVAGPSPRHSILKASAKRALDEASSDVDSKKTRIEGEELIDGSEDPVWDRPLRGSKRGIEHDEDEEDEERMERDKRARKVSLERPFEVVDGEEEMDVDEVHELPSIPRSRGKKRDRAEAGSTIGADDEEEREEEREKSRRKRRNKRKSDVGASSAVSRGKKRDREAGEESEGEEEQVRVSRKKKGKRSVSSEEKEADSSMDLDQSLKSSGREIGEVWTSHGVTYKIGPNGDRLRETLLKAEHRFQMPADSIHPDRTKNIDIGLIEWLTEEQYRDAKARYLLIGQEDPAKTPSEPRSPAEESRNESPAPPKSSKGKHLLWDSTNEPIPSSGSVNPFSSSSSTASSTPVDEVKALPSTGNMKESAYRPIASSVGLRSSMAFPGNNRRVSLGFPGLADSTNTSSSGATTPTKRRLYSKIEKQELEAKGMQRVREERERKEREKAAKTTQNVPAVPTITLTQPADEKKDAAPKFSLPGAASGNKASFFSLTPSAPVEKKEGEKNNTAPPPAPLSLPAPPATKPQEKPRLGLGFPSSMGPPSAPASAPAPTFNLGGPKPPATAPAPAAATRPPMFSFAPSKTPAAAPSPAEKPKEATPTDGGSGGLLSRVGGFAAPSSSSGPAKPSVFAFNKPSTTPATPASKSLATPESTTPGLPPPPKFNFGINKPPVQPVVDKSPSGVAPTNTNVATTAPKFNFNTASRKNDAPAASGGGGAFSFAQPKTDSPAQTSAFGPPKTSNTPTSVFGPPKSNAPGTSVFGTKPDATAAAPSPFGFGTKPLADAAANPFGPKPPAAGSNPTSGSGVGTSTPASESKDSAPKFSFGAFGGNKDTAAPKSAFGGENKDAAPKSVFGNGNGNAASTTENKDNGAPKSAFPFSSGSAFGGGAASGNVFGAAPSSSSSTGGGGIFTFGGAGTKAEADKAGFGPTPNTSEQLKQAFGFGSGAASNSSNAFSKPAFGAPTGESPKPGFTFGGGTSTPTASPAFGSGGGFGAFGSTTPAGTPSSTSAFGQPATGGSSALAFGGNTTTSSTFNPFGTPANQQSQK